ncbi:MAG: outer membrane lipoprotein-sorting protein, partial [Desulfobacula sp.]
QKILEYADEIRTPQTDYRVTATVTSKAQNKEDKIAIYEVLMKGQDKTIIKTMAPEADKGTSMLMLRYDLWAFMPTISKPLRISLQQRLMGEAANGDIARANFSGDYTPELLDTVIINEKPFYFLELTAINENVTYHKVRLWIMKDTYYPLKGEFYAISGKLLKTCQYTNYKMVLEKMRPMRLILDNPLENGQRTIIDYDNMSLDTFQEKMFTQDYMKKLKY